MTDSLSLCNDNAGKCTDHFQSFLHRRIEMRFYFMQSFKTLAAVSAIAGISLCGTAMAQQSADRSESAPSSESRDRSTQQQRSNKTNSTRGSLGDDEARLHYDDKENRLSVEVDEDFRVPERSGNPNDWARNGKLDLRYDADRDDLKFSGSGTVDVDRASNSIAKWWQSWWQEEKSARRSSQQGAESGAHHFIREHDTNNDGYLARRELPANHRKQFGRIDRNDDGFLSQSEVRQYGTLYLPVHESSHVSKSIRSNSSDDETWSEWWASWWYDENSRGHNRDTVTADGASEFIQQHDGNDDGALVRSEMPRRMYDDFDRLDINDDGYVTRQEILRDANRLDAQQTRREEVSSYDR